MTDKDPLPYRFRQVEITLQQKDDGVWSANVSLRIQPNQELGALADGASMEVALANGLQMIVDMILVKA